MLHFGTPVALYSSVADTYMFKISTIDTQHKRTLVVEGKLMAPWVNELRISWKDAFQNLDGRKLVIDVGSLTVISREGEDALLGLMKDGAKFACCGVLTRYVLKRLSRNCHGKPDDDATPNSLHK
jgi:hypothetical protein